MYAVPTSMGPMDLRRFFSWMSVVDEERPSMDTVQRSLSALLWLCLVDIGRPRPIWPPPLPRPRPDTTTYTNARCEKNCPHEVKKKKIQGWIERKTAETDWTFHCLNRHVDVLILHSTVWRGAILFLSTKGNLKTLCVFLSHLSDTPSFHMIDLSYFYIEHQRQNMMHVAWRIFIWEWEVCFFSCRGRGGRDPEKRGEEVEGMCVCVCVCWGRGSIKGEEPCKRYGDCLTLSASVSMVTVTAAWWWQACREARGPCVAPRVTLLSACQYSCTWHTVLSYYHYCSIGMSTECQGSTSGTGQLYRRRFSFFYFRTAVTPQFAQLIYIYLLGEMVTGVQGTEGGECFFMTYPVLLWVANAPSASLRCSAWSLLLLSCHGDLPLDGLVERGCRPGALLLHWAVGGYRPLSTLWGWRRTTLI